MDALKKEEPKRCKVVYAVHISSVIKIHVQRVSSTDFHLEHYKDQIERRNKILEEIIRWVNGAHKLCNDPVLHGYKYEGLKKEPISAYLTATFPTHKEALEARNKEFPQLKEVYRRLRVVKIVTLAWLAVLSVILAPAIIHSWPLIIFYAIIVIPLAVIKFGE